MKAFPAMRIGDPRISSLVIPMGRISKAVGANAMTSGSPKTSSLVIPLTMIFALPGTIVGVPTDSAGATLSGRMGTAILAIVGVPRASPESIDVGLIDTAPGRTDWDPE